MHHSDPSNTDNGEFGYQVRDNDELLPMDAWESGLMVQNSETYQGFHGYQYNDTLRLLGYDIADFPLEHHTVSNQYLPSWAQSTSIASSVQYYPQNLYHSVPTAVFPSTETSDDTLWTSNTEYARLETCSGHYDVQLT